ncbi:hypothetical protein [Psychrosphaera aestuarii]|uniref:hypothetical protein n=1 Tax=Psychrosphaera aestuarii TaxID=1266052 RepID=UPI001B3258D8|nr:hypothetical protein [Psychrosphaera aestuarii]
MGIATAWKKKNALLSILTIAVVLTPIFSVYATFDVSNSSEKVIKVGQLSKAKSQFKKEYGSFANFIAQAESHISKDPTWVLTGVRFFNADFDANDDLTIAQQIQLNMLHVEALVELARYGQAQLALHRMSTLIEVASLDIQLRWHELSIEVALKNLNFDVVSTHFEQVFTILNAVSVDDYVGVYWTIKRGQFYRYVQDYQKAKFWLTAAEHKAQHSEQIALIVWSQKEVIHLLIDENNLFLANQAYQRLVELLEEQSLAVLAEQLKLDWALLNRHQLKYRLADKRLEAVYAYADNNKNRHLQLRALIELIKSQIDQNNLGYAQQLIKAANTLKGLPGALGRNDDDKRQTLNELNFSGARLALLNNTFQKAERLLKTIYISHQNARIQLGGQSDVKSQLSLVDVNVLKRKVAVAQHNWQLVAQLDALIAFQSNEVHALQTKKLASYRAYEQQQIQKENERQLLEYQVMNQDLSTAFLALADKLSNTRWLILILVFGLVFAIYNAVLRRQAGRSALSGHLVLQNAEKAVNQMMASEKTFSIVAIDFNHVSSLNNAYGVLKTDLAINDKLAKIKQLNTRYQVLPISGHRYWLIAEGYNSDQAGVLVTRIEKQLEQTQPLLSARYEICEVSEPTEFMTILNQLESNLAK